MARPSFCVSQRLATYYYGSNMHHCASNRSSERPVRNDNNYLDKPTSPGLREAARRSTVRLVPRPHRLSKCGQSFALNGPIEEIDCPHYLSKRTIPNSVYWWGITTVDVELPHLDDKCVQPTNVAYDEKQSKQVKT